jgi:chlorite dismutase
MADRHFVKYTFLQLDPAWRRLPESERAQHKREFLAACEDFGTDHLLQAFSLVGTHVVLTQSGLMKWATQPYSFLGLRKASEYSDEERQIPRRFKGKYLFVYPFVKTREWYALAPDERWRIMQEHIAVGREYPTVDNHTTYSFGLDDQEFVVAFDTDDAGAFLDLVQRLRTTEASAWTLRDTPSFTCINTSIERALNALDGEALSVTA